MLPINVETLMVTFSSSNPSAGTREGVIVGGRSVSWQGSGANGSAPRSAPRRIPLRLTRPAPRVGLLVEELRHEEPELFVPQMASCVARRRAHLISTMSSLLSMTLPPAGAANIRKPSSSPARSVGNTPPNVQLPAALYYARTRPPGKNGNVAEHRQSTST